MNTDDVIRPGQSSRPDRPWRQAPVTPQLIGGLVIMILGLALLLDRFGIGNAGLVFRLWPLAIVAFGVMHFTRAEKQHRFWGLFWIFTGSWLLLRSLGIVRLGFWELFWPVMLIAFGVSLVMRTLADGGYLRPDQSRSSHLFGVLSGSKQKFDGLPFEGAYMTAVMGGCELDLRRAVVPPGEERIVVVFALMGGHAIKVPPDWEVVVTGMPIRGGIEDKGDRPVAPPPLDAKPPRLILQGTVMMGGLELKN